MTLQALAGIAWKGGAILVLLWMLTPLLRRSSASVRHVVWTLGMAALLVLPALEWVWPAERTMVVAMPVHVPLERAAVTVGSGSTSWSALLVRVWAMVGILLAARLAASWLRIRRITGRARAMGGEIYETGEIAVPMTWGLWRYKILLPEAASGWPEDCRAAALLHERAHGERKDGLTQLIAQLACCFHWFNPLAWLAERRMAAEREGACDDLVVARGFRPSEYAGHLVSVAQALSGPLHLRAAVAMGGRSRIEQRVRAILDVHLRRGALGFRRTGILAAIALCAILPLAALRAQSTGAVTGVLYDPSGAVIPGADLVLLKGQHGINRKTSSAGEFHFDDLAPGGYELRIRVPGFAEAAVPVRVTGGRVQHIYPMLRMGEVSDRIEINASRPAGAASPQATPRRIRVGGLVRPPRLLHRTIPEYPRSVEEAGVAGTVHLSAAILANGSPGNIRVVHSPHPELSAAAQRAFEQWRYEPAALNGKPISTGTSVSIRFELGQ
jgi:TonB family protein